MYFNNKDDVTRKKNLMPLKRMVYIRRKELLLPPQGAEIKTTILTR